MNKLQKIIYQVIITIYLIVIATVSIPFIIMLKLIGQKNVEEVLYDEAFTEM